MKAERMYPNCLKFRDALFSNGNNLHMAKVYGTSDLILSDIFCTIFLKLKRVPKFFWVVADGIEFNDAAISALAVDVYCPYFVEQNNAALLKV